MLSIQDLFLKISKDQKDIIKVTLPSGESFQNHEGNPEIIITFKTRLSGLCTLLFGPFEFFEQYFKGNIDVDGKDALQKLMRMGLSSKTNQGNFFMNIRRSLLERKQNNKSFQQAKINATHHYGLPMEFFHILLGDTYGYSEGLWLNGKENLDEAKHNLYDYICKKLMIKEGDKLVEVGPAWGYLSMLVAEKYGAKVTGYGLVKNQNEGFLKLLKKRGLEDKITIVEKDHRDLLAEPSTYDKYVSVGVYEHAGKDCAEEWIRSIAISLKDGGIGVISSTFKVGNEPTNYCTIKHIFPGGYIPSLAETLLYMEKYDLEVRIAEDLTPHYGRAMEYWAKHLEERWEDIKNIDSKIFTESFRRAWRFYLAGVVELFNSPNENIKLYHLTFVKGKHNHRVFPSPFRPVFDEKIIFPESYLRISNE